MNAQRRDQKRDTTLTSNTPFLHGCIGRGVRNHHQHRTGRDGYLRKGSGIFTHNIGCPRCDHGWSSGCCCCWRGAAGAVVGKACSGLLPDWMVATGEGDVAGTTGSRRTDALVGTVAPEPNPTVVGSGGEGPRTSIAPKDAGSARAAADSRGLIPPASTTRVAGLTSPATTANVGGLAERAASPGTSVAGAALAGTSDFLLAPDFFSPLLNEADAFFLAAFFPLAFLRPLH